MSIFFTSSYGPHYAPIQKISSFAIPRCRVGCLLALSMCSQMTQQSNPRSACHITVRAGASRGIRGWCSGSGTLPCFAGCPLFFPFLSPLLFKRFGAAMDGTPPRGSVSGLDFPCVCSDKALFEAVVQSVFVAFPLPALSAFTGFQLRVHDLLRQSSVRHAGYMYYGTRMLDIIFYILNDDLFLKRVGLH